MNVTVAQTIATQTSGGAHDNMRHAGTDPKLRVNVVFTTPEGAVAALKTAAGLAKHLGAQITLLAAEVVPIHFSLDRPHVPVSFLERRYSDLVCEAGIIDEQVTIRIWLCRDWKVCLQQALAPRSVIVIGGSARWWRRRERNLARWLRTLGHHVLFVDSATNESSQPEVEGGRQAAFFRLLEKEARSIER